MSVFTEVREALNQLVAAKKRLRALGVIRSERFTGEVGEWFVEMLFDGTRAQRTSQKGWDLLVGDQRVQVKTHAKSDDNNARWTEIKYTADEFDELIVVVLSKELLLKEIYRVPRDVVLNRAGGKQRVIKWDSLSDYRLDIHALPKQGLVALFV